MRDIIISYEVKSSKGKMVSEGLFTKTTNESMVAIIVYINDKIIGNCVKIFGGYNEDYIFIPTLIHESKIEELKKWESLKFQLL